MSNPPWQPPPPARTFWQSWSPRRRVIAALVAFGVVAAGLYAFNWINKRYFPDYIYTIHGCSADARNVTVDFAITSKRTSAEDIRVHLAYRDQSGEQVGDDMVELAGIAPKQTVRMTQVSTLKKAAASVTCDVDHVYVD